MIQSFAGRRGPAPGGRRAGAPDTRDDAALAAALDRALNGARGVGEVSPP